MGDKVEKLVCVSDSGTDEMCRNISSNSLNVGLLKRAEERQWLRGMVDFQLKL
jgi:hypothetical protein